MKKTGVTVGNMLGKRVGVGLLGRRVGVGDGNPVAHLGCLVGNKVGVEVGLIDGKRVGEAVVGKRVVGNIEGNKVP